MTERTRRPSATQYAFLLDLVRRGGDMGLAYLTKPKTIDACKAHGWISNQGGTRITEAGRLAVAAFDGRAYDAAVASARRLAVHLDSIAGGTAQDVTARGTAAVIDEGMPEIMSATEVAELYGVSRQAVHKMIQTGRLPGRQAGTTWVMRREVVEGITVDGAEVIGHEDDRSPEAIYDAELDADTPSTQ